MLPSRGIYATVFAKSLAGIGNAPNNLSQAGSSVTLYTDFLYKKHVILATSFGYACNFGDYEIPQAQYLGFRQNLRGYRYQRFAGRSRGYNNTELRINFGDVNFYVFKGPFGVLGFQDIGRVWVKNETSTKWHRGYGGGLWVAPFNKILLTASLTTSAEENLLPMASIGFQF